MLECVLFCLRKFQTISYKKVNVKHSQRSYYPYRQRLATAGRTPYSPISEYMLHWNMNEYAI